MTSRVERARHRFHTKLTNNLARAYSALGKAESAEPSCYPALDIARVSKAKKQIERAVEELKRWEGEHPDE